MKDSVGIFEAKTHFTALIRQVGDESKEVVITRKGIPVAKIVPFDQDQRLARAKAAVERIKKLAKEMNLGKFDWEGEWKHYRDAGRKY